MLKSIGWRTGCSLFSTPSGTIDTVGGNSFATVDTGSYTKPNVICPDGN
jgi:hypothetical protein